MLSSAPSKSFLLQRGLSFFARRTARGPLPGDHNNHNLPWRTGAHDNVGDLAKVDAEQARASLLQEPALHVWVSASRGVTPRNLLQGLCRIHFALKSFPHSFCFCRMFYVHLSAH